MRSVSAHGDTMVVQFAVAGNVLVNRASTDSTVGVAIAGADRQFVWAHARVRGSQLLVWSPRVLTPVAVRYAWSDSPAFVALFDSAGLPAAPFRTDRW